MIILLVLILILLTTLMTTLFLLGFRIGGEHWQREVLQVRHEGARASREMHELTRRAFVSMAEEAERQRRGGRS